MAFLDEEFLKFVFKWPCAGQNICQSCFYGLQKQGVFVLWKKQNKALFCKSGFPPFLGNLLRAEGLD